MFAITGKDGKISVVRIGSLIAVFGVGFVIFAVIVFFLDQEARRSPLSVEAPAVADYLGQRATGTYARELFYTVPQSEMTVDEVAAYYNDRLLSFSPSDDPVECVRSPREGVYEDYLPQSGRVPYQYACMFDNSGFNTTQFTEVRIQPGIYSEDPENNTEGLVVIQYEQQWSP